MFTTPVSFYAYRNQRFFFFKKKKTNVTVYAAREDKALYDRKQRANNISNCETGFGKLLFDCCARELKQTPPQTGRGLKR